MPRARLRRASLALALGMLSVLQPALAADGTLRVAAMVLPRVDVSVLSTPAVLEVSAQDVARGYVEAGMPMALSVRSNLARGVMLEFSSADARLRMQSVSGAIADGAVLQGGASLLVPHARQAQQVRLHFRFALAPDARPGTYAWPVLVATTA